MVNHQSKYCRHWSYCIKQISYRLLWVWIAGFTVLNSICICIHLQHCSECWLKVRRLTAPSSWLGGLPYMSPAASSYHRLLWFHPVGMKDGRHEWKANTLTRNIGMDYQYVDSFSCRDSVGCQKGHVTILMHSKHIINPPLTPQIMLKYCKL